MEKICSWKWRPSALHDQQEDAFYWSEPRSGVPAKVVIFRNGQAPDPAEVRALSERNQNRAGYRASWMYQMLQRKPYDTLAPNMKAAFDYLNAKHLQGEL